MGEIGFSITKDVTGSLVFNRNIEVFMDYEELKQEDGKVYWKDQEDLILSKGCQEKDNPLPIISTLAKNFLKAYEDSKEAFTDIDNTDKKIIPGIIKQTIIDLNFHPSHLQEENWINPNRVTTKEYLKANDLNENQEIAFPLSFEIANLIFESRYFPKGERILNSKLDELYTTNYIDYLYHLKKEMDYTSYIFTERIREINFRPVILVPDDDESIFSMAAEQVTGIISLAWAELYFANLYELPFSICTYCGQIIKLTKNPNKSTCNNINCSKMRRKDRDRLNYELNPELERQKNRKRQQFSREKQKAIKLYQKGQTLEEIRKEINKNKTFDELRSINDVKLWIEKSKK